MAQDDSDERLTRRNLLQASLVAGGMSALSACLDTTAATGEMDVPSGSADPKSYPQSQHAWNDSLVIDPHGNTAAPNYQLLLFLRYTGSIPPTDDERRAVAECLESLDRAFQRGTGGDPDALILDGLLTMVGYSPDYFAKFDDSLPQNVDLPFPEVVLDAVGEGESKADHHDAVVAMTSDRVEVLLAAEQALRGNRSTVNDVDVPSAPTEVFEVAERRTGFKGEGLMSRKLAAEVGIDAVSEESPSAMGYKSGFSENQATERRVTIREGPFAGGTTLHVSRLTLDLDSWYDLPESDRVDRMFSPDHTVEMVGEAGKFLASDSRVNEEMAAATTEHTRTEGVVGHTQKLASARDENFEPRILRRSEAITVDGGEVGFNFTSVQRTITDFIETRRAMTFVDGGDDPSGGSSCPFHGDGPTDRSADGDPSRRGDCPLDDGILEFLETERRANFLVPPRRLRALPEPSG
ncbi:DUF7405 family protein [Halopelagius longus]|uniref:Deferrochelatase/peroxidase EfeB n=1 Tax=Halopelagius longus TaxID=1236180 RepID=A0A1H1FRA6_9EURY|nr:hypothetical protein [Halopelagius longus]RDI70232.1 hypothetical protein DWB78_16440 [Halopelagius longus]SDR03420.1 deferrochelatase/peroxidase EfeB [Halopelagius longus]